MGCLLCPELNGKIQKISKGNLNVSALLLPLMVEGFRYSGAKFKTTRVLRSTEVES